MMCRNDKSRVGPRWKYNRVLPLGPVGTPYPMGISTKGDLYTYIHTYSVGEKNKNMICINCCFVLFNYVNINNTLTVSF